MKPWVLVFLRSGRRFVHNLETKESLWTPPDDVQKAIDNVETDDLLILIAKARGLKLDGDKKKKTLPPEEETKRQIVIVDEDDEDGEIEESEEEPESQPQQEESSEGEDLGWLDEDLPSDAEEEELDFEAKTQQFRAMLDSTPEINPYGMWEEEYVKTVDDPRYDVFETTKERTQAFDLWARDKIAALKSQQQEAPIAKTQTDVSIAFSITQLTHSLFYSLQFSSYSLLRKSINQSTTLWTSSASFAKSPSLKNRG